MTIRPFAPILAVAAAALLAPAPAEAGPRQHPKLHQAIFEMRQAALELEGGGHDFGGHRDAALRDLRAACDQTEKALKEFGEPYEGIDPGPGPYAAYTNYPHLRHAEVEMGEARKALEQAVGLFGGHRLRAIADLKAATAQVEKCLKNAR